MKFLKGYLSKAIKSLFVIIFLGIVVLILSIPINYGVKKEKLSLLIEYKSIKKPSDIIKINGNSVKPIIYEDILKFKDFPDASRKERYIETLLPAILVVRFNLLNEKSRTERLWAKIRAPPAMRDAAPSNRRYIPGDFCITENTAPRSEATRRT